MSYRPIETYEVDCICGNRFETHAAAVDAAGSVTCPECKRVACVAWRPPERGA